MPTPECNVLKPVDASITNSDDWEIFTLNNAQVVYEENGKPASLLDAYADTPLKVVGTFTAGRGQLKYLLHKSSRTTEIELRAVTRFSYGELTDGEFAIWAEGKAGWFELRPAPEYAQIYEDMIQAVQLLYFVTDIYNEPRKRGGGPSPQLIFQEYAEDERFPCTDPAVAEAIFRKHHVFLTMCFLNRAHGISWSNTPIYQFLRRHYPTDFDTCKARMEGRFTQTLPERSARTSRSTPLADAPVVSTAKRVTAGRGKAAAQKNDEVPKKDDNWWEAAALFEFMQKAVNQRVVRASRHQITLERVAQLVVKRYEIEELETAQNVLLVHARNLCYMMDHPRRKSVRFFADEPIYQELAKGHSLSAAEQRRAEGVELRPRKDHATLKGDDTESSNTSSEEDIIATPVRRPPGRRKRGRLSVLRPTTARLSGKSKSVKGKAPMPTTDTSDASDAEEESENSDEETGIDTPTQVHSPSREKRKLAETDTNTHEERTRHKRTASAASFTLDSPPTTAESSDENDDEDDNMQDPSLPLHKTSSSQHPPLSPSFISTPLPTYVPNGPRDSWICAFDGCAQRIYGCSKDLGRQLITEHLEDHKRGREKEVGILWREQDKLRLPVSNLIKKIREMSEASTPLFPPTDKVVPQAIQRSV